jgi:V8-like Glu-specific endopeptidase
MRWMARRARSASQRVRIFVILALAIAACGSVLISAKAGAVANTGATADAAANATVAHSLGGSAAAQLPATSDTSKAFGGVAPVGALFTVSNGQLGTHFCTASVVHSAHGDLAVTAAHCVTDNPGQMVFVPGYVNGKEPYGVWPVTAVYTNEAWQSAQNPDDDFAFLQLADSGSGVPVEHVTGAEQLGTSVNKATLVQVVGYPGAADQPISCVNYAKVFSPTQLVFDCDGYTDGTSGGPFIAGAAGGSGRGTVVGVIGGYEQGGNTPDVSYAATFGAAVTALYQTAEAGG